MFSHLKYLYCFIFPACVVYFLYQGPHTAMAALAWTIPLWVVILLDYLSPKINPEQQNKLIADWFYDAILYVLSATQFLIIGLMLYYASQLQWTTVADIVTSLVNFMVLRILVGTASGSSTIIVAHELIHRTKLHMRILGRLLLYSVCYEHFVIAHVQGHHLNVGTAKDIATAGLGESFKKYWKRVFIGHFKYAWNFELERLNLSKQSGFCFKMLKNSVLQGLMIELMLVILILLFFGWTATFIFLYQAISAVRLLETINYYQHWGLATGQAKNMLAWVNQSSFTHYALVGLANHIDHHQSATHPFQKIPYSAQGPKMPYGYFVTNLWVKLNNASYRRISTRILKDN